MGTSDDIVIPQDTDWLDDPAAQSVCAMLRDAGHAVYFVGGCVRNALLGRESSDVDICTDARPERVLELAKAVGFNPVPTGIEHGTITVVAGDTPFEVTTFRRDVQTDGRRAVVAFSDTIEDDARRRDFTMNALYATPEGFVVDPLGGLADLHARKVRFIEDADARIREDYLRALRFFRFAAWYGDPAAGFDPVALSAIAGNLDGLETLSAERVGHEIRKLLGAPDPAPAVAAMRSTGVLAQVLMGADDRWLAPVVHLEMLLGISPSWVLRLAALGGQNVAKALRLSKAEARDLDALTEAAYGAFPLEEIAYRQGTVCAQGALMLRAAMAETPPDPAQLKAISTASAAHFPLKASDLMPAYEGPALGVRLRELEQIWIASGFKLKKSELLNHG